MLVKTALYVKVHSLRLGLRNRFRSTRLCCTGRTHSVEETHQLQDELADINLKRNLIINTDAKVEALRSKILYSEYLCMEKMRLGYQRRVILASRLRAMKTKELADKQMYEPTYSVMLNCLKDNTLSNNLRSDNSRINNEELVNLEDKKDAIHMPYSNTDKFKIIETNTSTTDQNTNAENFQRQELSELNKSYKILYEKYLEAKLQTQDRSLNFEDFEEKYLENLPLPEKEVTLHHNWMTDYHVYNDAMDDPSDLLYGTPDPNSELSSIPCGGCGAVLHCKDPAIPGYLPSEIFSHANREVLKFIVCQRCHFMKYYNTALEVKVSPEKYSKLLEVIKTKKCAVLLMVDLTDFPCSIWPDIKSVLHPKTSIFVVANKVDLLPMDSPNFETHVKECVKKAVLDYTGIEEENIRYIALTSAKTKYGIEELINKLHTLWKYKGDVYMIGCTNVGKSSLFNTLLQSDYCKVQATDIVQRATISPWPGTTLNLLKFPILNPQKWRLYFRTKRLISENDEKMAELKLRKLKYLSSHNIKDCTLKGSVGRTFQTSKQQQGPPIDPYSPNAHKTSNSNFALDETLPEFKYSHWCYDTPGTIQPDQVLDLLTTEELLKTLPQQIISPRTFVFKPQVTMFLGGLGRLDYLEGEMFIRCTVFASKELFITMCSTTEAEDLYKKLLYTKAFGVPINNPERLKLWPPLQGKEMSVTGINQTESAADIVLSSAGWIAITPDCNQTVKLKAWTPNGKGIYLRTPALLKKSVTLRGARVPFTPAYKSGRQVYVKVNI